MHNKTVIVNSTPVILLSAIGKLSLLKEIYHTVYIYISKAVYDEIMVKDEFKAARSLIAALGGWIQVENIINEDAKKFFNVALHIGEVEVMILAKEIGADLLIIDDYLARKHASYLELKVTGTLGVLLKAKNLGVIEQVKPLIDQMINSGIYIETKVYHDVLAIAGER